METRFKRRDLPVLTSLRFPAAAAIALLHYLPLAGWPPAMCEGLVSGVSFFYVLSGFILYYNYSDLRDRKHFWVARFARIWPLHFATLILALTFIPFVSLIGHASWPVTLPANLLLVQAWLPFHGSALSYNGVAWSLSVEAFFYLSFPWLLGWLKKFGPIPLAAGTFVLGLVVVAIASACYPAEPNLGSFNPLCRVFEFVLGMITCRFWLKSSGEQRMAIWSGAECLIVVMVIGLALAIRPVFKSAGLESSVVEWFVTTLTAASFALLIYIFAHQAGIFSRAFSARPFVLLGEISFAVYMCHQVILRWIFFQPFSERWTGGELASLYFVATLVMAFVLYFLVEIPSRHLILRIYNRKRLS